MRKFYSCSVGEKGKGYDEMNLTKIIESKAFILHENTPQKGDYQIIKESDILLLKYRGNFIAYGEALNIIQTTDEEWNLFAPVKEWFFYDDSNPSIGTEIYGMKDATLGGSQYGTVKPLEANFSFKKIKKINDKSELFKKLAEEFIKYIEVKNMQDKIELLKYKKQIILQGPPGTGKTRLAKMIAHEILKPLEIQLDDILQNLHLNQEIVTSSGKASFVIIGMTKDKLSYIRKSTEELGGLKFSDIQKAYKNKIWLNNAIHNGSDTYSAAVAKYIFENYQTSNCKLIQFHPSFSYEDFVRGISAKSNNNSIEYVTEDRILAKFAKEAYENYIDSKKPIIEYSKEKWVDEQFRNFRDQIIEKIDEQGYFFLTPNVSIVEVENDAFRYIGETWQAQNPHRMRFTDIKTAYLSNNQTRQELKSNPLVSGSAFQHATYYFKILQEFRNSIKSPMPNNYPSPNKNVLRYYVLIIDEINRANLPSVLGELIYALEYRGENVESMYEIDNNNSIVIPPNLFIIGTMNTADRSVGHIDYAIKRRFAFVDVLPTDQAIDDVIKEPILNLKAKALYKKVADLFNENKDKTIYLQSDFKAKDVQLGHSYFLVENEKQLGLKLEFEIKPLLNEYVKDGILNEEAIKEIGTLQI